MTGQKAIEGCRQQDRIAQKYIFDTWSDGMLMVCMRYVRTLADAEELMLNGFFNFFKAIDRFIYSGDNSIGGWLRKIMVNECLMFLRKKGELKIVEEQHAIAAGSDDDMLDKISAAEIFKLITALPAGYRTVFNMFAIEGYSHKEIAVMLGITESTSKSQLSKAKTMLQKQLVKIRS